MEQVVIGTKEDEKRRCCTICGNDEKGRQCLICARDFCEEHIHKEIDEFGKNSVTFYCISCWKVREPFERRIRNLIDNHNEEMIKIYTDWKKKSIEQTKQVI